MGAVKKIVKGVTNVATKPFEAVAKAITPSAPNVPDMNEGDAGATTGGSEGIEGASIQLGSGRRRNRTLARPTTRRSNRVPTTASGVGISV